MIFAQDTLVILLGGAASFLIILAFLAGYLLGVDAAKPRRSNIKPFLPMRGHE